MDRIPGLHVPDAADAAELASLKVTLTNLEHKLEVIREHGHRVSADYRRAYMRLKMRERRNGDALIIASERLAARETYVRRMDKVKLARAKCAAERRTLKKQIAFVASLFLKSPFKASR